MAKYVSLWPSASQPSVRWLLSKSIHFWIYYITYYFADLCISSSLPSRQKVGIVSEWNSSRSIFDIFKIHQNLKADINPWMMTCIWQRGNRRLAQIYTVARSCKSIPKKITTFGKWIYAEEIVKHSFLWMQLHQNVSDSLKQKLPNSDKTLRKCKMKFVQCSSFWTQLDSHKQKSLEVLSRVIAGTFWHLNEYSHGNELIMTWGG